MNKLLITIVLLLFSLLAKAGWYEVYTYDGLLAGKSVHFSIQLRGINSDSKDSILVTGIYKYNHINEPLELRGFLINKNTLKLKEYHGKEPYADIVFKWNDGDLIGYWKNSKKRYQIKLERVGSLIDLVSDYNNPPTEILMGTSFDHEYLVGVYKKTKGQFRASMIELLIKSKKNNSIIQRIDFDFEERPVGNVMTVIFANAIANKFEGVKMIEVAVDDGRMGGSFFMKFDEQENKYFLDN